jgi:hypothetical protein
MSRGHHESRENRENRGNCENREANVLTARQV